MGKSRARASRLCPEERLILLVIASAHPLPYALQESRLSRDCVTCSEGHPHEDFYYQFSQ